MKLKFLITLIACSLNAHAESPDKAATLAIAEKKVALCCADKPKLGAAEVSDLSIYQINSSSKNHDGESVQLVSLSGKIQVVTMGYSKCAYACPRLMADMKAVQLGLPEELRKKIGFNFFSVDPTDTPESLKSFGNSHKVNFDHWNFYSSTPTTIQELAVVLGTKYRRINDKDFAHSNLLTVLNEKGEIIFRQEGLSGPAEPVIKAIVEASK
ncbi:MAG: SCO family protein [Rubritalea sp.]|uniref:SCO family protein n=1 Tax=Rubritalea sp. TaxID=2109375 RepID=UPI00324262EE